MASDAEIDLVVNASNALNQAQRDLDRIVREVEEGTDPVQIRAQLDEAMMLRLEIPRLQQELERAQERLRLTVDVDVDTDDADRQFNVLTRDSRTLGDALGSVDKKVLGLAASLPALPPLLAGIVTSITNIAPAAAVAVTGVLALQTASAALKIGMLGVEDAIEAAFDPDVKPEELQKALDKLAPSARAFVLELRSMRKSFSDLRLGVQEQLFSDLDDTFSDLAKAALPSVRTALEDAAGSLNNMGRSAARAAEGVAEDGTLGQALKGATRSLENLELVPAQVVKALAQLAAAGAPHLERLTQSVAKTAEDISKRLTRAFESGALGEVIDTAIAAIKQLGRIAGNVFGTLNNILGTVTTSGGGLFTILEKITGALEEFTATKEFQDALSAIVFLLDKVQEFLAPVVSLFLQLAAKILPILTPIIKEFGEILGTLTPFLEAIANTIGGFLSPILEGLAKVMERVAPHFGDLADKFIPKLTEKVEEFRPHLEELGKKFGDLLIAMAPVIEKTVELGIKLAEKLLPIIGPLIEDGLNLLIVALDSLADVLEMFVIPAFESLTAFLEGDYATGLAKGQEVTDRFNTFVVRVFLNIRDRALTAVGNLVAGVQQKFAEMRQAALARIADLVDGVARFFNDLPGRIRQAFGDANNLLFGAGADIINGLIQGLDSRTGGLLSKAAGIARTIRDTITSALDINSPSRVMIDIGGDIVEGLNIGLRNGTQSLRNEVQALAAVIPSTVRGPGVTGMSGNLLASAGAPTVNVFLGNRLVNDYVDTRVTAINKRDTRIQAQGIRR